MTAPATGGVRHIEVTRAEAGQKLLQFLQRRLGSGVPQQFLMRIIRKGEVRVNKGRAKPYDRVSEGDVVRIPPVRPAAEPSCDAACAVPAVSASPLPQIIASGDGLLVINKPAGLPVQPGTGHTDCVTARLAAHFAGADFMPAPAHRLDKNTSGLLLAGTTYTALRTLQDLFRNGHSLIKDYCAWVCGIWPEQEALTLTDVLVKEGTPGKEKIHALPAGSGQPHTAPPKGREALCQVVPLLRLDNATLLGIRLATGRTHQIRVQLASRNHPVIGDVKYGAPACRAGMLLHAFRLVLPAPFGREFFCPPPWQGRRAVAPQTLRQCRFPPLRPAD
ncbi:RluA family pseudouridine synthase [Oleidesulfovibrio alaskensis]|jgi:23S rRNA pseudouridine955/2504/2580 synthase|uniref:RluA family pseudouridine synthase n=1 Tax=Oleidesulfovibrio alaskensis TaxID=58180 RepID=UPI000415632A|nr:RluA family pseudouridine synthase [Oleidesulfovibrio alaskensis]